ncbi:TIGR02281 family clan AA aspartic protease [Neorhizobium lilium]|uniref:TIGR02281 family clan AA aspartic protease n=1 Tax=Neorhizobium lilium TaxID=2503024 RepID=A0A444LEN8_9HYPH|nr:TIGR02281 family clan AA aspartic protease [Neorhizobium lilium]RWX76658.1 TIGR02281 family clan AA aspartic protease [Neorhizobium lilium]
MLLRTVIFAAFVALLATQIPALITSQEVAAPAISSVDAVAPKPQLVASANGRVRLQADSRGHFNGSFRINGRPVDGVIDTGASMVAINESTARKLGFTGNGLDFRYTVTTANGTTDGAHVVLDRIEIGSVRVKDVDAMVMRDKALSGTLVGMSFLKKLKSYQAEDGSLTLNQ